MAGVDLPVVEEEPDEDGYYVVPAGPYATRLRRDLLEVSLADLADLHPSRTSGTSHGSRLRELGLPEFMVTVHRAPEGQLYLYSGCCCSRGIQVVVDRGLVMHSIEGLYLLPISAEWKEKGAIHVNFQNHMDFQNDVERPSAADSVAYRRLPHSRLWAGRWKGDTKDEPQMAIEDTSQLDLVLNRCRDGKREEFSFVVGGNNPIWLERTAAPLTVTRGPKQEH